MDMDVTLTARKFSGIRLTFRRNVLLSYSKRTAEENFEIAKTALGVLLDLDPKILFRCDHTEDGKSLFEDEGGTVEFYRECG